MTENLLQSKIEYIEELKKKFTEFSFTMCCLLPEYLEEMDEALTHIKNKFGNMFINKDDVETKADIIAWDSRIIEKEYSPRGGSLFTWGSLL
jgi:hypothetical protein